MDLVTFVQSATPPGGAGSRTGDDLMVYALRNPPPIPAGKRSEAIELARHLLEGTTSNKVRNAAALFLADLSGAEAKASIISVLRRPDIAEASGSLLFALSEAGQTLPLELAASLLEAGSLEAQGEILNFLEGGRIDRFEPDELAAARRRLTALLGQDGRKKAAALALEYLDELTPESPP